MSTASAELLAARILRRDVSWVRSALGGRLSRRKSFCCQARRASRLVALTPSIMPRGCWPASGYVSDRVRLSAPIVAVIAAIFGAMPVAVLVAAFAVPVVYIVYIYDVNLWEDEPLIVTGLAFLLTGALTIGFTILWTYLRGPVPYGTTTYEGSLSAAPTVGTFLLVALVVPIVGEAIRQIGPVLLASRPEFDDLMDGLSFGVISGVSYSCFDTLVRQWDLLTGGLQGSDPGLWVSLIFLEGFVKPLIIGTASGIAVAEFSGLGRGYDGFTPRYFRGVPSDPGQCRLSGRYLPVLLCRRRDARRGVEHSLGLADPGDLDSAGSQRFACRFDGGRLGTLRPRPWHGLDH